MSTKNAEKWTILHQRKKSNYLVKTEEVQLPLRMKLQLFVFKDPTSDENETSTSEFKDPTSTENETPSLLLNSKILLMKSTELALTRQPQHQMQLF